VPRATLAICLLVLFACCSAVRGSANDLRVLTGPEQRGRAAPDQMMRHYLRGLTARAFAQRRSQYEKIKTADQIAAYQIRLRRFFIDQLGGFPAHTRLNATVVGKREFPGHRIEKIIYESRPGFFVTAILYLPKTKPPYPGILFPCGHSENGKAAGAYQKACILLAQNGMAVLCFDPIGQGERKQLLDAKTGSRPRYRATTEHMVEGVAPILLGRNLATYMIWDGMRGIDYLQSRPDIDPKRIGCTGNSGGGNLTSFLMALDPRISCAAPGCFITTTQIKNERPGPGDAEQNIHGQIAGGLDHPDFLLMRAPRPALICAATRDFVPIEGTWRAFRQAKRFYGRLGYAERIDLIETDAKHGFSLMLREGVARWFSRWLLGRDVLISEGKIKTLSDRDLQCSPNGQVVLMKGAKTIFDLNVEYEERLAEERRGVWVKLSAAQKRDVVRKASGIAALPDMPQLTKAGVHQSAFVQQKGYRLQKTILSPEKNIVLSALLFEPDKPTGDAVLYVHGQGKAADTGEDKPIRQLVARGYTVLAVDLRGMGETRTAPWRYKGATDLLGYNAAECFIAYMLGRSFLAMRTADILVSARYLRARAESNKHAIGKLDLVAVGEAGPAALHAMALEPDLFDKLTLRRSLISWKSVIETPVTRGQFPNVVHGVLKHYDLPDLVQLVGTERVNIEEPVDAAKNAVE